MGFEPPRRRSLAALGMTDAAHPAVVSPYRPLDAGTAGSVQALVVTGSPTRPTGAFHARSGALTITGSRADLIEGRFDIDAVGFEAAEPGDESRELVVRGAFTAAAGTNSGLG